jgi:hypothetical protein
MALIDAGSEEAQRLVKAGKVCYETALAVIKIGKPTNSQTGIVIRGKIKK